MTTRKGTSSPRSTPPRTRPASSCTTTTTSPPARPPNRLAPPPLAASIAGGGFEVTARLRGLLSALALALLVPAVALADFDNPSSTDTSQQYVPPAPGGPTNPQREDTPNDPDYDQSEPDSGGPGNLFDERFDLFGFPSALTATTATYKDTGDPLHTRAIGTPMVSGFNAAGAWKATRGRADVSVSILDTGMKWNSCGLRDKLRLNAGELAGTNRPQKADGSYDDGAGIGGRDLNANGAFDVDDYANDPRVGREFTTCGAGVTGKDLINEFS